MLPVFAIIGRPNVGKSTLFNRLTHTREALVANFPGLTRDRKYGRAKYDNQSFIVVDTGGIDNANVQKSLESKIVKQTSTAINEADVVLFILDARVGLTIKDQLISKHLHRIKKTTILVVNKIEGIDSGVAISEFWQLGFKCIFPISALNGHGIKILIEYGLNLFSNALIHQDHITKEKSSSLMVPSIKLAIIGRPNVGKSTLINRILGKERVIVDNIAGTTRDSIYIPTKRNGHKYILIDTAGIRRRKNIDEIAEKFSVIKTLASVKDSNVVLFIIDAHEHISEQDLSILGMILNTGCSIVIVVNKWDALSKEKKIYLRKELDRRLHFINFVRIHFISALHGNGIRSVFKSVQESYKAATMRLGASTLTRILKMATSDHQPPIVGLHRVKLKYAHPGGYNPPVVVIHGNLLNGIPDSYKRYLVNYYRKSLGIIGTPIHIKFHNSDNPFSVKLK
ncbi:small GTP-binding protein [Candidatus Photodesmus katoptron Akat1]|uniref:GTPase Der n=1 Tax=Candidatus Photodesmus katoptron Akat1 TaxID=1236703 RepID=S3EGR6_9GAMM|nr:small GTP-binding protein [Candidatus Photodesmus katoptron Akat1]